MAEAEFYEEEFTGRFNSGTVLRILGLARNHSTWLVGFLITIGLTSAVDSYFTFLGKRIVDEGILANNANALMQIALQYAGLLLIQALNVLTFIYLAGVLGQRIQYDLRKKTFNHLQKLSLSYFDRTPIGWIMSRVTSDSERIAQLVTWGLLDVTWAVLIILASIIFMLQINWKLTLVVIALLPPLVYIATQFKKRILGQYRLVRKLNSRLTASFNEQFVGVRVIKALNREEQSLREFNVLTDDMYSASYRAAWLSALFLPVVIFISSFALGGIAYFGGVQVQTGALTLGGIQAFVAYIALMLWPIQDLSRVYAEMQNAIASAERVFSLIDSTPEIQNLPGAYDPGPLHGDIVFEDVEFSYEPESPVLSSFSLHIARGETIALVGPTGGGKSTIVNLVCRFYEPKAGRITIGGVDYKNFSLEALQSKIGMVLQTPHLFSGTILENLRYGRIGASLDQIEEAARISGAHDFIKELEKGYDTEVGEGGIMLSVGQKQLISLARAILSDPEIFIMDEATSSVDTLTEALIQRGMEAVTEKRTSFIIAHRLSTIKRAHRILVIDAGKIIEEGSHSHLIKQRGYYYRLYTEQFRRQLESQFDPFQLSS